MPLDDIEERLQAYGERFMQMFDDYEPPQQHAPVRKKAKRAAAAIREPSPAPEQPQANHNVLDGIFQQQSKRRKTSKPTPVADASTEPASQAKVQTARKKASKQGSKTQVQQPQRVDAAEHDKGAQVVRFTEHKPLRQQTQHQAASAVDSAAERAAFMSARTGRVHGGNVAGQLGDSVDQEERLEGGNGFGDFKKIQREVEQLGATALEKRDAKAYQAAYLESLGAKTQKMRIPKNIGLAMWEKQKKEQEAALNLALESGMLRKQDVVKQRRDFKAKHSKEKKQRGLGEDAGVYKQGLLRVHSLKKPGGERKMSDKAIERHAKRLLKM